MTGRITLNVLETPCHNDEITASVDKKEFIEWLEQYPHVFRLAPIASVIPSDVTSHASAQEMFDIIIHQDGKLCDMEDLTLSEIHIKLLGSYAYVYLDYLNFDEDGKLSLDIAHPVTLLGQLPSLRVAAPVDVVTSDMSFGKLMFMAGTSPGDINNAVSAKHLQGTDNAAVMDALVWASGYMTSFAYKPFVDDAVDVSFVDWGMAFTQVLCEDTENLPGPGEGGWGCSLLRQYVYLSGLRILEGLPEVQVILDRMIEPTN